MPKNASVTSASKHTPGPWELDDGNVRFGKSTVAIVTNAGAGIAPEADANARLIAAAPELLERLLNLCITLDPVSPDDAELTSLVEAGRAAIARARGEE